MDLSNILPRDLDKFIEDNLLPDTSFRKEVKQAIEIICDFLKERCFQYKAHPVRVSKVVKVSPPAGPGVGWGGGCPNGRQLPQRKRARDGGLGAGSFWFLHNPTEPQLVKTDSGGKPCQLSVIV